MPLSPSPSPPLPPPPPFALGKRRRRLPPRDVLPLADLPDAVLLRVMRFLCAPHPWRRVAPHAHRPCVPSNAFNLAVSSRRLLRLFRRGCLSTADAVPDRNFLEPLARSDARFRARDPTQLRTIAKLAGPCLAELHLPLYDCSMEDAQWSILSAVARHCHNLATLSFVDSLHHTCTTPPHAQRAIFANLLASVKHLSIYVLREADKLHAMARVSAFSPESLVLHQIDPKLYPNVIDMLANHGRTLTSVTLSFEQLPQEYKNHTGDFALPFLCSLSNTVAQHLGNLNSLRILTGPHQNPLCSLPGPAVSTETSKHEFDAVSTAIQDAKLRPRPNRHSLKHLVFERVCPRMVSAIRLFSAHCDPLTQIEVSLHEVLLVSPPRNNTEEDESSLPYFRATKLHSSSWMIKGLAHSYFRRIEHIHVGADEDCSRSSRPWYDRLFPKAGMSTNPDMQSFKFLCQKSGSQVKSVYAKVSIESSDKANAVLQILSAGFAYARDVRTLEISGDVLKYIGLHHSLLYSIVGQLNGLEELYVSEAGFGADRQAQLENLPVLLRGLWMFCRKLRQFKFEFSSFGCASSVKLLRDALNALLEFDRKLPGVETHNLGEFLELSLKHCAGEGREVSGTDRLMFGT